MNDQAGFDATAQGWFAVASTAAARGVANAFVLRSGSIVGEGRGWFRPAPRYVCALGANRPHTRTRSTTRRRASQVFP